MLSLVTAGAGFLGSRLVNALVDDGEEVIILDDLSVGHVRNLEHSITSGRATFVYWNPGLSSSKLSTFIGDLATRRISRVYYLAPPAGPQTRVADPSNLIELALAHRARFMFLSMSDSESGRRIPCRYEETAGSAGSAESATLAATAGRALDARVVRVFDCYGPGMDSADGHFVPELMDAVLHCKPIPIRGDGSQQRALLFVDDAVSLLRIAMDRPANGTAPIVAAGHDYQTDLAIGSALARIAGIPFRAAYAPTPVVTRERPRPNLTRALALGWVPSTPLEYGLRATFRWFSKERRAYA